MIYNSFLREFSVRLVLGLFILLSLSILVSPSLAFSQNQPAPVKIVVLGDSLSAGLGLGPGEAFPEQLAQLLQKKNFRIEMVNAGVSGDTSTGGLARLDWSIQDGTNIVIVELGANDALRGISPALTRKNIENIITRLQSRSIKVILAGMLAPPNMGEEYGNEFNGLYPDLAKKYSLEFYPFFLKDVVAIPELNQADGIHPTNEGIAIITANFLPHAIAAVERVIKNR